MSTISSSAKEKPSRWKIRIHGFDTIDFTGTEAEAEQFRRGKALWERSTALKWRTRGQTEYDKLTAEIARYLDAEVEIPEKLMLKWQIAKEAAK